MRVFRRNFFPGSRLLAAGAATALVLATLTISSANAAEDPGSLFADQQVSGVRSYGDSSVEVGVRFKATKSGELRAIRFLKAPGSEDSHTVSLWGPGGSHLASATSTNETASGWQEVAIPTTPLERGQTYVASYHTSKYAATNNYFSRSVRKGSLRAPAGHNGVYSYGAAPSFPRSSYRSTNYWVDVVFRSTSTTPEPVPITTSTTVNVPSPTSSTAPPTSSTTSSTVPPTTPTTAKPTTTVPPTSPGSALPIPIAAGKTWNLAFSEEFNGTDYDHSKLTPCFDWNYGACTGPFNHGRETYKPSQVRVSNGTGKLVAEPLSPPEANGGCFNGQCTYKAGLLSTARPKADNGSDYLYKFTYGYVEAKLKVPGTQGFFTAFWMLPANPSYNYRSEIDILELLGDDPKTAFMTYHYNDRARSHALNSGTLNNGRCAVIDYSKGFHTFGVDWQSDHIAWYIDRVKCGEFTNAAGIENGPMQIILNQMVDNDWQRSWNKTLQNQSLTGTLEVDYIRVYQQR